MKETARILVTGASSGLGEAVVQHALSLGYGVLGLDLHEPKNITNSNYSFLKLDVTDHASIQSIMASEGPFRAIVHCAGIAPAAKVFSSRSGAHSLELFSKTMDVNVKGSFNMLTLGAESMISNEPNDSNERGVIILTSSIAAYEGQLGQVAYSASKGAVASMILPAARELGRHGVRVVGIAPGVFETAMVASFSPEVVQELGDQVTFPKRLGKPEEFATFVFHILDNPYINATVLRLDGGIRMS